jgi:hypothetical protein
MTPANFLLTMAAFMVIMCALFAYLDWRQEKRDAAIQKALHDEAESEFKQIVANMRKAADAERKIQTEIDYNRESV